MLNLDELATELKQHDDGRLLSMSKSEGRYSAIFNIFPYTPREISKEAFDEYLKFVEFAPNESVPGVDVYISKHWNEL